MGHAISLLCQHTQDDELTMASAQLSTMTVGLSGPPLAPGPAVCATGAGDGHLPITPFHGAGLMQLLQAAQAECEQGLRIGTRVWAKVRGFCLWPSVTWDLSLVRKEDLPDLLRAYTPGSKLVHFYGEHNCSWCVSLEPCAPLIFKGDLAATAHCTQAIGDGPPGEEGPMEGPKEPLSGQLDPAPTAATAHDTHLAAMREWGKKMSRVKLVAAALWELDGCLEEGPAEVCRVLRLSEVWGSPADLLPDSVCGCCGGNRAQVLCSACGRAAHALCLDPPSLDATCMPGHRPWHCPKCGASNGHGAENRVGSTRGVCVAPVKKKRGRPRKVPLEAPALDPTAPDASNNNAAGQAAGQGDTTTPSIKEISNDKDRLGLTPDWIIYTACHFVFGLQRPCPGVPHIPGLLDPCSNSKISPNLPAEKLYDVTDNGLLLANSWAGFWILLNPDYRSQTQWRFVNRAIDEVESGHVPGILLLCRNSTDSAYFQRLRPYPRVLLRRNSAHFKDYDRTTPGFGVAAILLATPEKTDLYTRFHQGFSHAGEASIPIDATFMQSSSFVELCGRLRLQASHHQRDHWVQCASCGKWRIIPYHAVLALADGVPWTCAMLRPPHSNCRSALTRTEQLGMVYAHSAAGNLGEGGNGPEVMGMPVWHQPAGRQRRQVKATKHMPARATDDVQPKTSCCLPEGVGAQLVNALRRSSRHVAEAAVIPAGNLTCLTSDQEQVARTASPPDPPCTPAGINVPWSAHMAIQASTPGPASIPGHEGASTPEHVLGPARAAADSLTGSTHMPTEALACGNRPVLDSVPGDIRHFAAQIQEIQEIKAADSKLLPLPAPAVTSSRDAGVEIRQELQLEEATPEDEDGMPAIRMPQDLARNRSQRAARATWSLPWRMEADEAEVFASQPSTVRVSLRRRLYLRRKSPSPKPERLKLARVPATQALLTLPLNPSAEQLAQFLNQAGRPGGPATVELGPRIHRQDRSKHPSTKPVTLGHTGPAVQLIGNKARRSWEARLFAAKHSELALTGDDSAARESGTVTLAKVHLFQTCQQLAQTLHTWLERLSLQEFDQLHVGTDLTSPSANMNHLPDLTRPATADCPSRQVLVANMQLLTTKLQEVVHLLGEPGSQAQPL